MFSIALDFWVMIASDLNVTLCRNSCLCFSPHPHDCAVWQEHSDVFHMAACFSDLWIRLLYLSRRPDPCS